MKAIIFMFTIALATMAHAGSEVKLGTMTGKWCGSDAKIQLTKHDPATGFFHGTIRIIQTGQVDKFRVRQLNDMSLRLVRFLSGYHHGQTQYATTAPPQRYCPHARCYNWWPGDTRGGVGCTHATAEIILQQPY